MKKLIAVWILALAPVTGMAAGGGNIELQQANIDLNNHAAIQRGAKLYVNYCQGCHATQYIRYQLFKEVGLSEDDIKENLMFADGKIGDLMTNAMSEKDAAKWFGAAPPDLTLTARIKHGGADWIYSFLKGFYTDPSRPLGVNNTIFANVGMPHVLYGLQGIQDPIYKYEVHHGASYTEAALVSAANLADVRRAAAQGPSYFMLNETAIGRYPVSTVHALRHALDRTGPHRGR